MSNKYIIFGTGTPRSGGALTSNLISTNKNILFTNDLIHFFRHIYKRKNNLSLKKKIKIGIDFYLRLKYRQNIIINLDKLLEKIILAKNYKQILIIISNYILAQVKKEHVGEYANGEWRNINNFLKLDNNFKAFQVIRDPRAMLVSWKKITYEKNFRYLNIIFNWIDALNYYEKNKKKYKKNRFIGIKFEDIHLNPEAISKKICKFLKISYDKNMLITKEWPKLLKNKFYTINFSSYNNKKIFGFSKNRINNWQNHILDWELTLIQFLLKRHLKKFKYKILKDNPKLLSKGLNILKKDKILNKNLKLFLKNGDGCGNRLKNPSNPKNWSATDLSKNPKLKFIDTLDYKKYFKEKKLLIKKFCNKNSKFIMINSTEL